MVRPELTSTLTGYVDLHRHAAVRAELASHPSVALRVMVAHAIAGSPLWKVEVQSQRTRNDAVNESIETCSAEVQFDERSEEHTSELQSLMRISYAVFCLKKKNKKRTVLRPNCNTKHTK